MFCVWSSSLECEGAERKTMIKRNCLYGFLLTFVFLNGCATYPKTTLKAKTASGNFLWVNPEFTDDESLVYGQFVIKENEKIGMWTLFGREARFVYTVVTKSETKEPSKWLFGRTKFYWRLPTGTYKVSSIIPSMKDVIEPTSLIFKVPEAGKAYYVGSLELDLNVKYKYTWLDGDRHTYITQINDIEIVNKYVEAQEYLDNRNPLWRGKSEISLMQIDPSVVTKILPYKESAYKVSTGLHGVD